MRCEQRTSERSGTKRKTRRSRDSKNASRISKRKSGVWNVSPSVDSRIFVAGAAIIYLALILTLTFGLVAE